MVPADNLVPPPSTLKIEKPKDVERLGAFYYVLLFLSLVFIGLTLYLFIQEGTGKSLPAFLKLPVA